MLIKNISLRVYSNIVLPRKPLSSTLKLSSVYVRTICTKQTVTVHNTPVTPNLSHTYTMFFYPPVIVSKYRFVTVTIIQTPNLNVLVSWSGDNQTAILPRCSDNIMLFHITLLERSSYWCYFAYGHGKLKMCNLNTYIVEKACNSFKRE